MKIAINGFGRIGRAVFRVLAHDDDVKIVAVNDIAEAESLAYLLKYDSVMGRFDGEVHLDGDSLVAGKQATRLTRCRHPSELPWKELGVDVVVEATGRFRRRADLVGHLEAGAGKILTTSWNPGTESCPTLPARRIAWGRWPRCWTMPSVSSAG
jgi:glyceraldehyde 3-phosphate dehydrogenase